MGRYLALADVDFVHGLACPGSSFMHCVQRRMGNNSSNGVGRLLLPKNGSKARPHPLIEIFYRLQILPVAHAQLRHGQAQIVAARVLVQPQAKLGQHCQQVVEDVSLNAFVHRPLGAGGEAIDL